MHSLNNLNTEITRYLFQFLEPEDTVKIGLLNNRLRNIFNLKREHIKLFLFTLNNDIKKKFIYRMTKYINFIEKKFPLIEEKTIIDFVLFYIRNCYSEHMKYIDHFEHNEGGIQAKQILNLVNSNNYLEWKIQNETKSFKDIKGNTEFGRKTNIIYTGRNSRKLNSGQLFDNYYESRYELDENKIICKSKDNNDEEIIRDYVNYKKESSTEIIIHNNHDEISIRKKDFNYNLCENDFTPFKIINLDFSGIDELEFSHLFENIENFLIKLRDFNREIHVVSNIWSKEFSDLISKYKINLVTLIIYTKFDNFKIDFSLFLNKNSPLRKVHVVRKEDSKKITFKIGEFIKLNTLPTQSSLTEILRIIERNLQDDESKNWSLEGDVKFIIEFCNFLVKNFCPQNFKKFLSKIFKLSIEYNYNIPEFEFNDSTKENIHRCFREMTNIKVLKIQFLPRSTRYIDLFRFNLLKSLNTFKYSSPYTVTAHLYVLEQLKDFKIKYISIASKRFPDEFKEVTQNLKHLVKFKADLLYQNTRKIKINQRLWKEFLDNNKNMNEMIVFNECLFNVDENLRELKDKYRHISFAN